MTLENKRKIIKQEKEMTTTEQTKKLQTQIKPETFDLIKKNSKERKMSSGAYLDFIFLDKRNKTAKDDEPTTMVIQKLISDVQSIKEFLYNIENNNSKSWWKRLF